MMAPHALTMASQRREAITMSTNTLPTATDADMAYATNRRTQATWYAWGVLDASPAIAEQARRALIGHPMEPFGAAQSFGHDAYAQALAYRLGRQTSLPNIMDQLRTFLTDLGCEPPI
jgi:hypothetical protein